MLTAVLIVPAGDAELAADRLWSSGARAVEERVDGTAVELISALGESAEQCRRRIGRLPPGWELVFREADDEPASTWRQFARPIPITDTIWLVPAWQDADLDDTAISIAIEPGAAFGLGDHPTTRLSATAVAEMIRPGDSVLDVGCGTGVLSVLAASLGASDVVAIDVADAAVEATDHNAERNAVAHRIVASNTPLADVEGEFDLVVANILAPTLVALAEDLRRTTSTTGHLVVSGILAGRHGHVTESLRPMRVLRTVEIDEWAALVLTHPESSDFE